MWKTVESILDDIKVCIFSSITLQETEIDEKVERVEAALTEYADKYTKLKKDKRETLNRVYDYIEKVKRSNNRTSIINTQSNSNPPVNNTAKVMIFKPQSDLKTQSNSAILDEESESDESDDEQDADEESESDESDDEQDAI